MAKFRQFRSLGNFIRGAVVFLVFPVSLAWAIEDFCVGHGMRARSWERYFPLEKVDVVDEFDKYTITAGPVVANGTYFPTVVGENTIGRGRNWTVRRVDEASNHLWGGRFEGFSMGDCPLEDLPTWRFSARSVNGRLPNFGRGWPGKEDEESPNCPHGRWSPGFGDEGGLGTDRNRCDPESTEIGFYVDF